MISWQIVRYRFLQNLANLMALNLWEIISYPFSQQIEAKVRETALGYALCSMCSINCLQTFVTHYSQF